LPSAINVVKCSFLCRNQFIGTVCKTLVTVMLLIYLAW